MHQESDFVLVCEHIGALYAELFGEDARPSRERMAGLRDQVLAHPDVCWFFAGDEGYPHAPITFCSLAESFAVFANGRYGILNELWVAPHARSRGIGAQVLDHCREFGRARGWQRIDVSAPPDSRWDRSFAFYQKHGFAWTGRKLKTLLAPGPPRA